jgi:hypothetical protein
MIVFTIFFISINTLMCRGANTYFFIAPNISMILEYKNDVIRSATIGFIGNLFHWDPTTAYLIKNKSI